MREKRAIFSVVYVTFSIGNFLVQVKVFPADQSRRVLVFALGEERGGEAYM